MAKTALVKAQEAGQVVVDLEELEVKPRLERRNELVVGLRAAGVKVPRILENSTGLSRTTVFETAPKEVYSRAEPVPDVEAAKAELLQVTSELADIRARQEKAESRRDEFIVDAFDAKLFVLKTNPEGVVSIDEFAPTAGVVPQRVYQVLAKAGRSARSHGRS